MEGVAGRGLARRVNYQLLAPPPPPPLLNLKDAMGGEAHLSDVNLQFIALILREGGISHTFVPFIPLSYRIVYYGL